MLIKDVPTIVSLAVIVTTFVVGFVTTVAALIKNGNAREATLRKELMDENRALRAELKSVHDDIAGLKSSNDVVLAENLALRLQVTELESEVRRLKTELKDYENAANCPIIRDRTRDA